MNDATSYSPIRIFFFQAEDGIRDLVRSRGLGDVYKRQPATPRRSSKPGKFAKLLVVEGKVGPHPR